LASKAPFEKSYPPYAQKEKISLSLLILNSLLVEKMDILFSSESM